MRQNMRLNSLLGNTKPRKHTARAGHLQPTRLQRVIADLLIDWFLKTTGFFSVPKPAKYSQGISTGKTRAIRPVGSGLIPPQFMEFYGECTTRSIFMKLFPDRDPKRLDDCRHRRLFVKISANSPRFSSVYRRPTNLRQVSGLARPSRCYLDPPPSSPVRRCSPRASTKYPGRRIAGHLVL
jgi:hypothetical protein